MLSWVGRNGPFIDEDRLAEEQDLFHCFGIEVTEGGLGEAARRTKAGEIAVTFSFAGGDPDFAQTPLPVAHGFEDESIGLYAVENFWDADDAIVAALAQETPATTWRTMIEAAQQRYPGLIIPDALYEDDRLSREPFDAVIRDRFYALLAHLDLYVRGRNADGSEGPDAKEVVLTHFQGDRALFSPESPSNQTEHKSEMTFRDPDGGQDIFAHWHGKISRRFYRLHFEWPMPATAKRLKILYIGPKLTKN